jgi:APA family basic amino acid/polyamine antiporter
MPSPWIRKPLSVVYQHESTTAGTTDHQHHNHQQVRHLSVWDLIGIGVGGTIGSGIFVLTGQIAAQYAGPLTWASFVLAGAAACCSGVCYAELSARIPAAGSTYVYSYVCLGEVAAVVAAACLTLEYAVAGAAVARSWGDKVFDCIDKNNYFGLNMDWMHGKTVSLPAGLVSAVSTVLLLAGVQESKAATNYITAFKMAIVLFMIVGGFLLFQPKNMSRPLAPYGVSGVLRGATTSFFGYLGYDEVCCVAGEALRPAQNMPRAVMGTLIIVSISYVLASIALTGMVNYTLISPTSGFPEAFETRGIHWAASLTGKFLQILASCAA